MAQHRGLSTAILFLDLRSAFHHLIRESVFGPIDGSFDVLQACLTGTGFDVDAMKAEYVALSADFLKDVDPMTQQLLQDAHCNTWFTVAQHDKTYCTRRGSRPGSPLADLAFNSMMSGLIRDLQQDLDAFEPLQTAFQQLDMRAPVVTWVDDLAIPLVACDAAAIESIVQQVMKYTLHQCSRRGLTINFAAGKTEGVIMHRGRGAPEMRRSLFIDRLGHVDIDGQRSMAMVGAYEHLGTAFTQANDLGTEIRQRIQKAVAAHRKVARTVFANRRLAVATRLQLLESLVLSIQLHGSGSWPLLSSKQFQQLHRRLVTWQRSIVGKGFWSESRQTDRDFQAAWKLVPLAVRLIQNRLSYGFKLVRNGPNVLLDFITALDECKRQTWMDGVRSAICWVVQMQGVSSDRVPVDSADVIQWLTDHGQYGPKLIKRLVARYLQQEQMMYDLRCLHRGLVDIYAEFGVRFHADAVSDESNGIGDHVCPRCQLRFSTRKQLCSHRWTAHNHVSSERMYVFDTTCRACNQCLWTAARLQQHLRASRSDPDGCYAQLTRWCAPLTTHVTLDKPHPLREFLRLPACPTAGPQLPLHHLTQAEADAKWTQAWNELDFPAEIDPLIYAEVARTVECFVHQYVDQWQDLPIGILIEQVEQHDLVSDDHAHAYWALCLWCKQTDEWTPPSLARLAHFDDVHEQIWQFVRSIDMGQLLLWRWRMDEALVPADNQAVRPRSSSSPEHVVDSRTLQVEQMEDIIGRGISSIPPCSGVPVCLEGPHRVLYILHLFSGRRRQRDFHWWIQHLSPKFLDGYDTRVLSIDTAVHDSLGNLGKGTNFELILSLARKGAFAASLCGPPCETFSAARHLQPEASSNRYWPRPLRSAECPWALAGLTVRELEQVHMGSLLMLHTWQLEASTVLSGGMSLKEHPAPNSDPAKASIWRNPTHASLLMKLPEAFQIPIAQWKYGCPAVKPTVLRSLNMGPPKVIAHLLQSTELPTPVKPRVQLAGTDETGSFRTAAAKEYPERLAFSMAITMLYSLQRRLGLEGPKECCEVFTAEEAVWLDRMATESNKISRATFLPDYQGGA